MQLPKLNFRNVRLIVYTVFTWIAVIATASAQNCLHKTQLSLGPGRNRILTEARQIYKTASSTTVDVQADDLHGLSVAVMFCTGFLGLIYIILQNGIFLDRKEIKWLSGFVHWVNSARGHLVLFICAVILWAGTILTTSLSLWLAFHRGQSVQIHVDGASLNQETIGTIKSAAGIPTRYWGHGYVRFMCIAPWSLVVLAVFPVVLHAMAYRRLRAAEHGENGGVEFAAAPCPGKVIGRELSPSFDKASTPSSVMDVREERESI